MKKTVYCLTPQNSEHVFVDRDAERIIAITPPDSKTIKVILDKSSFRTNNCTNCKYKIDDKTLVKQMKSAKVLPSSLNKVSYCQDHSLCTSSDQMLALCIAGHKLTSFENITINVPRLAWIFDYQKTGKETFRLYAVLEQHDDGIIVLPYLLSNVYTKPLGCISWPKNQSRPTNLRQAYNTYWESPFSDESWVVKTGTTYIHHLLNYDVLNTDIKESFINTENMIEFSNHDADGVFISSDPSVLSTIPRRINSLSTAIGTLRQGANSNWLININNHLFMKSGKLSGTAKLNLLA